MAGVATVSDPGLADRLARLFEAAVARGDVAGVAALVCDARSDLWAGACGARRLGSGDAMTADTIGWIASMTKPLTTAAVLQLVERGLLDLDEAAQRWAPALGELQVLTGFDAAGQPVLRPPKTQVTLRQLLTHAGGLGYEFWSEDIKRYAALRPPADGAPRQHRYFAFPMLFDPGTRWNYGVGIDWAGRIVEAATGARLGDWIAEHLTGPLGMVDTRFGVPADAQHRVAAMHQRTGEGSLAPSATTPPAAPEWDMGGGGMYGTVLDYGRFIRMILNRGRHEGRVILHPDCVELMCRNQIGALRVAPLRSALPQMTHDAEFFPGVAKAWTLGFQVNLDPAPTGRPAGGLMWAGLSNCYFWIDPVNGIGGAYMTQVLPFVDARALDLYCEFEKTVYDALARNA